MSLVSSRRMFLKMFGSVVVVATLPKTPIVAEPNLLINSAMEISQSSFPNLPPNVIHVQRGSEWKAITELLSIERHYGSEPICDWSGRLHVAKGARFDIFNWEGLWDVGDSQQLIQEIMNNRDPERYAISMRGQAFEFDAIMNEASENIHRWREIPTIKSTMNVVGEMIIHAIPERD